MTYTWRAWHCCGCAYAAWGLKTLQTSCHSQSRRGHAPPHAASECAFEGCWGLWTPAGGRNHTHRGVTIHYNNPVGIIRTIQASAFTLPLSSFHIRSVCRCRVTSDVGSSLISSWRPWDTDHTYIPSLQSGRACGPPGWKEHRRRTACGCEKNQTTGKPAW